ncbi:hypothetical protein [Lacticaseibacillus mingshuiensis]|uniref:hypothetical protein n=1 Tax=Lacticaseibacillus mingshuiensis TaxID=2799574 RepID=UPI0019520E73|nr:hypothetical protein [Lacticaseibacillus mingshuiensis]
MLEFDWQQVETREYSRRQETSFVTLTTRGYLTVEGEAPLRTHDPAFLTQALLLETIAARISEGPDAGIPISGFRSYRPYPVQAVWSGGPTIASRQHFQLWLKQPLFVTKKAVGAAITALEMGPEAKPIQFKQLEEGTEIQISSPETLTDASPAWQTLTAAVQAKNLDLRLPNTHREVYLDGVRKENVLVRLAIESVPGPIDARMITVN